MRRALLLGFLALTAAVAPAAAREPASRTPAPGPAAPKADRDRDGVFEDLETRIEGLGPDARVPVIVTLDQAATADRVARIEREVGGFALEDRFQIIDAFAATVSRGQVRALAGRPGVATVEHDSPVRALNDGAQAAFGVTEARLDAPSLDGNADGNPGAYSPGDLVAAVLDSGIDATHSDLNGGKVLAFKDFIGTSTTPYDDDGHGTHVAATIAGDGDGRLDRAHRGVAPGAALVGVKVLNASGSGSMSGVTAGIDWVVANRATYGIEAINLSLGVAGCSDGGDATSAAVNRAHDAGIVVAVAAGNEGPGTCTVGSPGAAAKALTVGAMADTAEGGFHQAWFSSRGRTADGRIKPDVSAPGVDITSAAANTVNGYTEMSGTSMATPFVAGVALLMRDAGSGLSSQQVKDRVMQTAVDWGRGGDNRTAGSRGADIDYGAGRLDAYAALASAGAPLTSPPPTPQHELRESSLAATGARADFPITVTSTAFPIAATMTMAGVTGGSSSNPDFDLYLLDPSGRQVAASEFSTRQDEFGFRPTVTGTYTVRVVSHRGSGNFFVDISAGMAQDTAAPQTTIDSGPSGTVNSTSASFNFSSNESGSTFECRLDSPTWGPCSSPRSYSGLSPGTHTFEVRATDAAGNVDASPATRSWTIDTTPPDTTITSVGPSGTVNSSSASFSFTSEAGATFECRLDSPTWGACSSPRSYSGLSQGPHTFEVRARDAGGNVDGTPASRTWSVDTVAPAPTLTTPTSGTLTRDSTPSLSGAAGTVSGDASTVTVRVYEGGSATGTAVRTISATASAGSWSATVSPALGDGTYTARAEQADGAGNTGFSSPVTFTIDTVAPDTSIDSGPSGTVSSTSASFRFSSEPGATFECRRDSGDWSACQSPKDYASLGEGSHTFEVRATDAAGNVDPLAASRTWTVDTTPPQTTLDSPPSGTVSSTSATFDFSANDAGATFQCRLDGGDWGGCGSPKGYSSLGDGPHTFEVRARDGVGNTDPTPASATWIVDTGPPETTIDSGPSGTVTGASVSFEFSANEPGSTFQCRRDGGDWAGCTSPESYGSLSTGEHSFEVRATDAAGNTDSTAAQRNFTVAEPDSPTESSGGGTRPGEDAGGGSGDGGGAAATGDGGGAPTATADQAVDSAAPDAAISLFSGQTVRAVVRRGLRVRLFSSEVGTATITVDLSGALARRLGLARRARRVVIGRRKLELSAPGPTAATVKLTRRGRAALRRARGPVTLRVRTVVADRLGNARVVTKRVRLRR